MWPVCPCMCAQERALAAHRKHACVKAIIISAPAVITTSDNPLLNFLLPSVRPPSIKSLPPTVATLTNPFLCYLSSYPLLFALFLLLLCLIIQENAFFQHSFLLCKMIQWLFDRVIIHRNKIKKKELNRHYNRN